MSTANQILTKNSSVLPVRQRILQASGSLFYEHGYRAVGIDRIIDASDVAKASFYNHFPSKDDLIIAWLELADEFGRQRDDEIASRSATPLLAILEGVVKRAREPSCRGCTFQVSVSEFPEADHPIHQTAQRIKDATVARYADYARAQNIADAERVARQIFLLVEGIWASVRMYGQNAPLDGALEMGQMVLAKQS